MPGTFILCLDFHDSFCTISNNGYFNTSIIEQEESLILIRDCIYVILSLLFRNKGVIAIMHFNPFPDSFSFTMQFIAMAETIHTKIIVLFSIDTLTKNSS